MNRQPEYTDLLDVLRLYFESQPILDDYAFLARHGSLEYAADANVLVLCQYSSDRDEAETARLISGPEGADLAVLYARHLAGLLTAGPRSDIDEVSAGYSIFPAHSHEFDRWHINAIRFVDTKIRDSVDVLTSRTNLQNFRDIIERMLVKYRNHEDPSGEYARLRQRFPGIVDVLSGNTLSPIEIGLTLERLCRPAHQVDASEIKSAVGPTIYAFLKSSPTKKIGTIRADVDTLSQLIAGNFLNLRTGNTRRSLFLTFDHDLIALRHAFQASKLSYKGWPLADLCGVRDARLIPFMPGFNWAVGHIDGIDRLKEFSLHMEPVVDRYREDINELDLLIWAVRRLWIADNSERATVLRQHFSLLPPERNPVSAMFLSRGPGNVWAPIASAREQIAKALELLCLAGKRHDPAFEIGRVIDSLGDEDVERMFLDLAGRTLHEAVRLIRRARWIGPDDLMRTAVDVYMTSRNNRLTPNAYAGRMPLLLISMTNEYFANLMSLAKGKEFSIAAVADVEKLDSVQVTLAIAYLMALAGKWDNVRRYAEEGLEHLKVVPDRSLWVDAYVEASMMAAAGIRLSGRRGAHPLEYLSDMRTAREYVCNAITALAQRKRPLSVSLLQRLGLETERAVNAIFVHNHLVFFAWDSLDKNAIADFLSISEILEHLMEVFDSLMEYMDREVLLGNEQEKARGLVRIVALNVCSAAWFERFVLDQQVLRTEEHARRALKVLEGQGPQGARQSYADKAITVTTEWWLHNANGSDRTAVSILESIRTEQANLLHYEDRKYEEYCRIIRDRAAGRATI